MLLALRSRDTSIRSETFGTSLSDDGDASDRICVGEIGRIGVSSIKRRSKHIEPDLEAWKEKHEHELEPGTN